MGRKLKVSDIQKSQQRNASLQLMLLVLKRCRLHTRLNIYREPESRLRPELWSSQTSQAGWVRQEGESCVLASFLVYFHCQTVSSMAAGTV